MSKDRSKQDIIRYRIEQQKQAVKNSAYFAAPMSVPEMDYFAKTRYSKHPENISWIPWIYKIHRIAKHPIFSCAAH